MGAAAAALAAFLPLVPDIIKAVPAVYASVKATVDGLLGNTTDEERATLQPQWDACVASVKGHSAELDAALDALA